MENNTIGEKLKKIRLARNKTQEDVAQYMGVARNTVSNWENGERNVNADQLIKLAKYFQVTLDYFADQKPDENFFGLLMQLSNFFEREEINDIDKDKAYQDIMKIYLKSKESIGDDLHHENDHKNQSRGKPNTGSGSRKK